MSTPPDIRIAASETDTRRCYPVMTQLRPHVTDEDAFVAQVTRQRADGYALVFAESGGAVTACAGFRVSENLAWGRFLYVDDLITDDEHRSLGHGGALMDWLIAHARENDCDELHLDSGVHRFAAHRFYLQRRMDITSHHFAIKLKDH